MISVEAQIRLVNSANAREHWAKRAKRANLERKAAFFLLTRRPSVPCAVKLVRIAPRAFDSDNLAISFKAIRDGIADRLRVNDNDPRVTWEYAQEQGKPKQYSIRIEIVPRRTC